VLGRAKCARPSMAQDLKRLSPTAARAALTGHGTATLALQSSPWSGRRTFIEREGRLHCQTGHLMAGGYRYRARPRLSTPGSHPQFSLFWLVASRASITDCAKFQQRAHSDSIFIVLGRTVVCKHAQPSKLLEQQNAWPSYACARRANLLLGRATLIRRADQRSPETVHFARPSILLLGRAHALVGRACKPLGRAKYCSVE